MSEKIKLSISLLVSNSIDTIEKCMQSLQPILQNVSSELIIVDTGGTDGSIEIARKYATQVLPFAWCNDFAKARNTGLIEAKGEWFMYLDDDEWFEDVEAIISFFNSGEYLEYNSASYGIRNYANKQGSRWEDVTTHRMVKREKKTQFVSPIHETLAPIKSPVKRLDCYVHHYGYAYANQEEARKHSYRNIPLLKEVLSKNSNDYRLLLQLIKEYCVINEYEMALQVSWDALKRIQKSKDYNTGNIRMMGWILCNIVKTNILNDENQQAVMNAEKFLSYHWINEITKNILYYWIITVCYDEKKFTKCLEYIPKYEETYHNLMQNEDYRRSQVVLEQENMLKETILTRIYTMAVYSACTMENHNLTDIYFDKMMSHESGEKTLEELKGIFTFLLEDDDETRKIKIVSHLLENNDTEKKIARMIDEDIFDDDKKGQICLMISAIDSSDIKILPYHIYANYVKGNRENIKKYLQFYLSHQENILEIIQPILNLIKENNIDILKEIERKDLKIWTVQQSSFIQKASEKKIEIWIEIIEGNTQKDFNTNLFYMRAMERKMGFKNIAKKGYQELRDMLEKYTVAVKTVYNNVYREDAFENEYSVFLPKNCRFAQKIKTIYESNVTKTEEAKIMKEAAEIYPEMADVCKYYLIKVQEAEKEEKEDRQEFVKLGNMIKDKIRMFIYRGEYEVAKQTLNQLKAMLPNDPELLELESRLLG